MKTKHLVAMALPLVFTACSQEELVTENNQTVASNRKVVENVVFKFNDAAESRLAFDDLKYKWEKGDKFGACLMDQLTSPVEMDEWNWSEWFSQFELVDYIQSNYPFTRQEDKSWTNAEAVMQEGNYFFYYPFNSNMGGKRTAIRINVPVEQYVAEGKKTYDVLGDQIFLAYAPIVANPDKEGHETITNITMEPLLAFPAFNITNNTGYDFTISRIAIGGKDDGKVINFPTVLTVNPTDVNETDDFNVESFVTNDKWTAGDRRAEILKMVNKESVKEGETTTKVNVTFGENGKVLKSGENFTSYIMLPSVDVLENNNDKTLDELKLYIYTNKGLITVPLNKDENNDDIALQNPLTSYSYNDGSISYIRLDEKAFETPGEIDINSTRDLEDLVVWNKNTQGNITAIVKRNVTITKNIYDVLASNSKLDLTLQGDGENDVKVTIPADAPANAIDRVNFNGLAKINIVNEGNVTITKDFTTFNSLTNNGTLSVTCNLDLGNKVITNNGTLTFDKKGIAVNSNNGKTIENNGSITVTANVSALKVTNNAAFTINEGIVGTDLQITNSSASATSYGTLTVNGVLNKSYLYNKGTVIVGSKGNIVATSGSKNYTEDYLDANNKVVYSASIQNSGVISGINNAGTIVMVTKDAKLTSATGSNGGVDNTICSPYVAKVSTETIYAVVSGDSKASEIAAIVTESNAKELRLSGNVTIDPKENETEVLVRGEGVDKNTDSELNVVVNGNLNIITSNGKAELGFVNKNHTTENPSYAKFTVNAGAKVDVKTNSVLAVGQVDNKGTITVQSGATIWTDSDKNGTTNIFGYWNTRK